MRPWWDTKYRDTQYSKTDGQRLFWKYAKEGKINDVAFMAGYRTILEDYAKKHSIDLGILNNLYNDNLFDITTHRLVNKNTYATVKKFKEARAAERSDTDPKEDIDFAIMALAKFWSMLFIDNLKTMTEEELEKEKAEDAEKRRQKIELRKEQDVKDDATIEKNKSDLELLLANKDSIVAKATKDIKEFMAKKEAEAAELIDDAKQRLAKVKAEAGIVKYADLDVDDVKNSAFNIDLKCDIKVSDEELKKNFEPIADRDEIDSKYDPQALYEPRLSITLYTDWGYNLAYITADDIRNGKVQERIDKLLDSIDRYSKDPNNRRSRFYGTINIVNSLWSKLRSYISHKELGEKAQADADAGRSTKEFEDMITNIITNGRDTAEKERDSWAGWAYDDGDSGAAYHLNMWETISKLAPYIGYCNWEAKNKDGYTVSCRANSDPAVLQKAIKELVFDFGGEFKVISSDEVDEPKKTLAGSADYSDELIKDYDTEA